jgi:hypothetical protein
MKFTFTFPFVMLISIVFNAGLISVYFSNFISIYFCVKGTGLFKKVFLIELYDHFYETAVNPVSN